MCRGMPVEDVEQLLCGSAIVKSVFEPQRRASNDVVFDLRVKSGIHGDRRREWSTCLFWSINTGGLCSLHGS